MKAKKTKKKIEKRMQEIADCHPNLENMHLYLEACFSIWPYMKDAHELSATILLEYYSMTTGKLYYCEHLKGEDWVRLDYVRPMKGIIFDLQNSKVISNGVEADLIALSEDRLYVENEYNKAMKAKRA
jgi:hypothetical protein